MTSFLKNKDIVHPELSYKITGLLFQAHNELGRYCREKQYADKFEELLKENDIIYEREVDLKRSNKSEISGNVVDFLIDNKIILEFKAQPIVNKDNYYQLKRYLDSTNIRLGLLVNFRRKYLKPVRVLSTHS